MDWEGDFQTLWRWSAENVGFWDLFWDWHGVVGEKGPGYRERARHAGARFFPDATLNYAENMLADDRLPCLRIVRIAAISN